MLAIPYESSGIQMLVDEKSHLHENQKNSEKHWRTNCYVGTHSFSGPSPLPLYLDKFLGMDILHQWYYATNNKAPSPHQTKIKYFGSVRSIEVKCYLNFL